MLLAALTLFYAVSEAQAQTDTACVIDRSDPLAVELHDTYRMSGLELQTLVRELRDGRRASVGTLTRYKRGDNAARYAWLAQAAYRDAGDIDWDGDGAIDWRRQECSDCTEVESGFSAAVYERTAGSLTALRTDGTQVVVAFRGTQMFSARDWTANITQGIGYVDRQQKLAMALVARVLASRPPDQRRVALTGHSLGGRLAQLAAEANGLDAYTFNAAAVRREVLAKYDLPAYPFTPRPSKARITSVISAADFVNPASKLFVLAEDRGTPLRFEFCGDQQGHGIDDLADRLRSVQCVYRAVLNPSPGTVGAASVPACGLAPDVSAGGAASPDCAAARSLGNPRSKDELRELFRRRVVPRDLRTDEIVCILDGLGNQRLAGIEMLAPSSMPDDQTADQLIALLGSMNDTDIDRALYAMRTYGRIQKRMPVVDVVKLLERRPARRIDGIIHIAPYVRKRLYGADIAAILGNGSEPGKMRGLYALIGHYAIARPLTWSDIDAVAAVIPDQPDQARRALALYLDPKDR